MTIEVVSLGSADQVAYAAVVARSEHAMLYHSLKYRTFLRRIAPEANDEYLVGFENGVPMAALPSMSLAGPYGRVANSLPFFGSHGGLIDVPGASAEVCAALIRRFHEDNVARGVRWATMVGNPCVSEAPWTEPAARFCDKRVGQITPLPAPGDRADVNEALLAQCHQKTRNMIRKGQKQDYAISHDGSPETLAEAAAMHRQNLHAIGGIAKEFAVFAAIAEGFEYDIDYRIYRADTAESDCAATLLVFYFKDFVEYFVPSSAEAHRANQPLSALIHLAMADAVVERGSKCWNWGGTWLSQEGVYRFKSRWGTTDLPYTYRTWDYDPAKGLADVDRATLASHYRYFYTLPYGELDG